MRYVDEGKKKNSGRGNKKRGVHYFVIVQWGGTCQGWSIFP